MFLRRIGVCARIRSSLGSRRHQDRFSRAFAGDFPTCRRRAACGLPGRSRTGDRNCDRRRALQCRDVREVEHRQSRVSCRFESESEAFAARLAAGPTKGYDAVKAIRRTWEKEGVRAADRTTLEMVGPVMASNDATAAIKSFVANGPSRSPHIFSGN